MGSMEAEAGFWGSKKGKGERRKGSRRYRVRRRHSWYRELRRYIEMRISFVWGGESRGVRARVRRPRGQVRVTHTVCWLLERLGVEALTGRLLLQDNHASLSPGVAGVARIARNLPTVIVQGTFHPFCYATFQLSAQHHSTLQLQRPEVPQGPTRHSLSPPGRSLRSCTGPRASGRIMWRSVRLSRR